MRIWRRKRNPREAWVSLLDSEGRVLASTPVVVYDVDPLSFTVEGDLTFREIQHSATVTHVQVTDLDGRSHTVPVAAANPPE